MAVARARVAVKGAAQIFRFEQARQAPCRRRLDFAAILAQLRRNEIKIERTIEFRFITDRRNFFAGFFFCVSVVGGCETIFVQCPAALERAIPQHDVVLLAAREITESERIFRAAHNAQISLDARAQTHTRLGCATRDDIFHERMTGEDFRDRLRILFVATMKSRSRTISFRRR